MMKLALDIKLFDGSGYMGFGPLGLETMTPSAAPSLFAVFISSTIGLITLIAIIWFIINLVTGAISIIASGGDKQALEAAKKKITSGLIGLLVTIFALFIIGMIGWMIGFPSILSFQDLFSKLIIK